MGTAGEELDEGEEFGKRGRRGWGGEELDEGKGFELFIFWFGVLDVEKQKKQKSKFWKAKNFCFAYKAIILIFLIFSFCFS